MKRILITAQSMDIGGVERSLIGLLEALQNCEVSVDVFLMKHGGDFEKYLPDWVNLLPEDKVCAALTTPGLETLKKGQLGILFRRFLAKEKAKNYVRKNKLGENTIYLTYSHKQLEGFFPELGLSDPYDLAISFLGPHYLVANHVNAKTKVGWIHTDYSSLGLDREEDLYIYQKFDFIAGVSEAVCDSFISLFPELKDRVYVIENCLPKKQILEWSKEAAEGYDSLSPVKLLSIGRFCYAKNFESIPSMAKVLEASGLDFHWYLIGYGGMEQQIRDQIKKEKMEHRITILGKKSNPYPYIRLCSAYIQPSRYEGCAVAVREAQLLGKPVIVSQFPTSYSQVHDGFDGLILPLETEAFATSLSEILHNPHILKRLENNCTKNDYSNFSEADKVLELIV